MSDEDRCFKCQERGHYARNCPNQGGGRRFGGADGKFIPHH